MLNSTAILIQAFAGQLSTAYQLTWGGYHQDYSEIIVWAGRMALENIANGDALYHNMEHTMLVTLVGLEILKGKHMSKGGVSPEDWLNFTIALLCHDIGYVKGVCRSDRKDDNMFITGKGDEMITLPDGASDASLAPFHVERGKRFVEERFAGHPVIDCERIKHNIHWTTFPVPDPEDEEADETYPDLLRCADLIGQLGDPRYLQKMHALFYEFKETGVADNLGFKNTEELRRGYPQFYWNGVFPYIQEGLQYLDVTQQGKQILANLYSNVFRAEHLMSKKKGVATS